MGFVHLLPLLPPGGNQAAEEDQACDDEVGGERDEFTGQECQYLRHQLPTEAWFGLYVPGQVNLGAGVFNVHTVDFVWEGAPSAPRSQCAEAHARRMKYSVSTTRGL